MLMQQSVPRIKRKFRRRFSEESSENETNETKCLFAFSQITECGYVRIKLKNDVFSIQINSVISLKCDTNTNRLVI